MTSQQETIPLERLARSSPVRRFMLRSVEDHRDPATGEVNATKLAEAAALAFDLYEKDPDRTIPEALFEEAAKLAF